MVQLVCFVAGVIAGGLLVRQVGKPYWHRLGFAEGAAAENQVRRMEEHKFRLALWQDRPAHAVALLIGEIHTHYQPTPLMWVELGKALVAKMTKRRILDVTSPGSPKSKKVAR
jgi:hypothetical protein